MDHLWISSLKSLQFSRRKKQQLSRNIFFFFYQRSLEKLLCDIKRFGEWNGNLLQHSFLGNSMNRGAWQATVHGVTKSQTRLSDSATTAAYMTEWLTYNPSRGCGQRGVFLFTPCSNWKKAQKVVSLGSYPCVPGCCGLSRVSECIPSLVWKISRSEIILNIIKYNYNNYD